MKYALHTLTVVLATTCIGVAPLTLAAGAQEDLGRVTIDLEMPFPENPEQVGEYLQLIEENAVDIRQSADRVIAFNRLPAEHTWLTHAWRWNRADEQLEELQDALDDLDHTTDMLLDGQRKALDVIAPTVSELRLVINEALEYLNSVRSGAYGPRYSELAREAFDRADTIASAAGLAESIGQVREHMDSLESSGND